MHIVISTFEKVFPGYYCAIIFYYPKFPYFFVSCHNDILCYKTTCVYYVIYKNFFIKRDYSKQLFKKNSAKTLIT